MASQFLFFFADHDGTNSGRNSFFAPASISKGVAFVQQGFTSFNALLGRAL